MTLRITIKNTKQLKKFSYKIFKKMHDLEKGKKLERIYSNRFNNDGECYILLCINHLKSVLYYSIKDTEDREIHRMIENYFLYLDMFSKQVKVNSKNRKKMESRFLYKLLSSHTELFNSILEKELPTKIDETNLHEWRDVITTSVSIWGNNI